MNKDEADQSRYLKLFPLLVRVLALKRQGSKIIKNEIARQKSGTHMASNTENRSWEDVTYLVDSIGARGSGTAEEEEAAGYVRSVLDGLNIAYEEQPFRSAASAWRPFAVMLGLAVLATLLAPLFLPASSLLAAFLLALSMWLTIRESLLQDTILRRLLPQVNSRNVIGRLPSEGEPLERIVLVAHLDTHRTPYFHRSRKRQHWFGFMIFFAETGTVINILLYLALSISGEVWLWWASLPFALLHLLMALVCAAVERTPYSPGANDNAAAVGTALQVARELRDGPLVNTDLWFLFSGCEEVGAYGMREFLKEYSPAIQGAQFIDLEMVGQGIPGVVIKEGMFRRIDYDPWLIEEACAAAEGTWQPAFRKEAHAYGESVVTQRAGYPSVTLNTVLAETGKTAVWHRMDDNLDAISPQTIDNVVSWVLALLRGLDEAAGSAGSHTISQRLIRD